jgi:hypothetical protein
MGVTVHDPHKGKRPVVVWTIGFVLLTVCMAWPQTKLVSSAASLSATVDKSTARIGDFIWLTLAYDLPADSRLPEVPNLQGIEKLHIVERTAHPGKIKLRFVVDQLETFQIGPVGLLFTDKDGNEQQIRSTPISIDVLSNLGEKPEEATLRPIQDIIPSSSRWMGHLLWVAVTCALLCLAIGWLWRRRKRLTGGTMTTMIDPPHIRARKEIDELVAGELFEKGEVKAFYFSFSEIIRRYMESIRKFPAAEMTTEEIVRHVGRNIDDQKILPLLKQADLVKFADTIPSPARKDRDLAAAFDYIRQTGPKETETEDTIITTEAKP